MPLQLLLQFHLELLFKLLLPLLLQTVVLLANQVTFNVDRRNETPNELLFQQQSKALHFNPCQFQTKATLALAVQDQTASIARVHARHTLRVLNLLLLLLPLLKLPKEHGDATIAPEKVNLTRIIDTVMAVKKNALQTQSHILASSFSQMLTSLTLDLNSNSSRAAAGTD